MSGKPEKPRSPIECLKFEPNSDRSKNTGAAGTFSASVNFLAQQKRLNQEITN